MEEGKPRIEERKSKRLERNKEVRR